MVNSLTEDPELEQIKKAFEILGEEFGDLVVLGIRKSDGESAFACIGNPITAVGLCEAAKQTFLKEVEAVPEEKNIA